MGKKNKGKKSAPGDDLTFSAFADLAALKKNQQAAPPPPEPSRAQQLAPTPTKKERRRERRVRPKSEMSDGELFAAALDSFDQADIYDGKFGTVESVEDRARLAARESAGPRDPHQAAAEEFEEVMALSGIERMAQSHVVRDVLRPSLSKSNVHAQPALEKGHALDGNQRKLVQQARKFERAEGGLPTLSVRGLSADDAIARVTDFVREYVGSQRFARVITGKGKQSEGEPVLKGLCASWFEGSGDVSLYAPELGRDGEFGAYLIQLRSPSRER